jgi:hypothetical protein
LELAIPRAVCPTEPLPNKYCRLANTNTAAVIDPMNSRYKQWSNCAKGMLWTPFRWPRP